MSIKELLSNKKYFMIKKKKIQKNLVKELNNELVDFFIYENNCIDEVYINDKEFMSFIDDKLCEYIDKTYYVPERLYKIIKEDEIDNSNTLKCYEIHSKLNNCIESLLENKLIPKTIGKIIYNELDNIINYGLMNIFLEYNNGDCKINSVLTNIEGFYEKYLQVIDNYIIRISEDKYNYYRKNIEESSVFNCDGTYFYMYDLIDYIVCYFPSSELVKENTLKILAKYKIRFEKQLYEKINNDEKNITFLLEKYIFNGIHIENWFVSDFINISKKTLDYVFNNFLDIICVNSKDIFSFIDNVERIYGYEYSNKIIECISLYNDCYLNSIVNNVVSKNNFKTYMSIKEIVSMIINKIMENENITSYSSIKKIGYGSSSTVYRIGTKVFKIGKVKNKLTSNYSNNPYIIKPLIREIINFDNEEIMFEVHEYVDSYIPYNDINANITISKGLYDFEKKYLKSNKMN